jgi:uncharacterized protein DUF3108
MPGSAATGCDLLRAVTGLVLAACLCAPAPSLQSGSPPGNAGVLPAKEALDYTVEWRLITAGKATLRWSANAQRTGWQANLHLESTGLVSKLYKVDDDYTASLKAGLCAEDAHTNAHEGSRQREALVHYDAESKKASYLERDLVKRNVVLQKEIDIPSCVHDVIGGLFFLRTLSLEPGHSIEVPVSDGKKMVAAKIEAQAREDVKVPAGTFKTVRYEAFLFDDVLYRRPGHLYVWLTDDRRKLPVRVQVRLRLAIGTITFDLEKEEKT